jgi:D-aminopeptidase
MPRVTDLGITIGLLPAGPTGSVLDVPGVGLGHATVWRDEPPPPAGRGAARTGVTVLDPGGDLFAAPVPAGGAVLNGAGECTGLLAAQEWGLAESPVFLTSTMQLGRVYDAACELLIEEQPAIGAADVIIPIVAECDDSFLNDSRRMQVSAADARQALAAARASAGGTAAEGAVGAGTGMSCLGYKGGIGTASRVLPGGATVGVLTLTNFGDRDRLTVAGLPAGRLLPDPAAAVATPGTPGPRTTRPGPAGSCIVVVITDGPLDPAACQRLARRAGLGLARTGSTADHGSGEIFLALATGLRARRGQPPARTPVAGRELDDYFAAVTEATEEAVLNSMLEAVTVTGRNGNTSYQLPASDLRGLLTAMPR